jgi:hypothetical protein
VPLQNRCDPFGELIADPARGLFMGNRGGRIHDDARKLTARRWASKQWICCALQFKGRHRNVWGNGYTELFFLDEVTALAAGHRPCFECRRADALAFTKAWESASGERLRATDMDAILHAERLDHHRKRTHRRDASGLPDAVMIAQGDAAFAVRGNALLPWSAAGYGPPRRRPEGEVTVLTPPSIIAVLSAGYRPRWHPSAQRA